MADNFLTLPPVASPQYKDSVTTGASLPSVNNSAGDMRQTLDTQTLYTWDGVSSWTAIATPGAAIALDGLIGDVTASGPGVATATLATVNGNVGSFTFANITVNAKGLITAASSGGSGGNLTDVGTDGIVITGGTGAVLGAGTSIAQHVSDATHNGYLSSADFVTFNAKQPAGSYITALTGDGSASGPGSSALTLATVNASPGTFNFASITVNGKGLVTSATASTSGDLTDAGTDGIVITGGTGAVIGSGTSIAQHVSDSTHNGYLSSTDWSTFNSKQSAGNYITALTGDVTATGPGSVAGTLATVNSNVGSFSPAAVTVNGKGLVTAASNVTTGNLTAAGTDGITITSGTGSVLGSGTSVQQQASDATHNGYLTSANWVTFNAKESALTFSTGLTRSTNTITANLSTGVSGGQSVIGGTAASENLTLSSTSNGTKGKIVLGSTSAYDEVNMRLGINNTDPIASIEVNETSSSVIRGIVSGQNSTDTSGSKIILRKSRGTRGSPTTVVTGDTLSGLNSQGYDGTSYLTMSNILSQVTGTVGTNRVPTKLVFQTATDAATSVLTTALTLNSDQTATFASSLAATKITGTPDSISASFDGQGGVVAAAASTFIAAIPQGFTITKWYIKSDVSGSCVIDVKHGGVSLVGAGNSPTLSSASSANASVSGWTTTTLAQFDEVTFSVTSASTVTKISVVLTGVLT